jgi:RNA polymerase sigma-70 factor, ECF subfamily
MNGAIHHEIEEIYRSESRRVLATLIRLLGDFDLAEDALQDAFAEAVARWPSAGLPSNPASWLISTGRFKAIDKLRRKSRFAAATEELALDTEYSEQEESDGSGVEDDRLRLIFTCCHPALPEDAQVALTLREVCGLTTEEIAAAFLTAPPTLAQRIVRAKRKIRDAGIPYEVPLRDQLGERVDVVLRVVYLVFNEGYSASSGDTVVRPDLSSEAIYLGRLLAQLLPEPEVFGLLGLMLLNESRREARMTPAGDIVLLPDQDRSLWDQELIEEGNANVRRAMQAGPVGVYTLQAAISAVHASAPNAADTDWSEIVAIYDLMYRVNPSPVVELNRAVGVAMRDGAEAGLAITDAILDRGDLADYHLAHATRADLLRRLGRFGEAAAAYERALFLARQAPERRFLEQRVSEMRANVRL